MAGVLGLRLQLGQTTKNQDTPFAHQMKVDDPLARAGRPPPPGRLIGTDFGQALACVLAGQTLFRCSQLFEKGYDRGLLHADLGSGSISPGTPLPW
jgi:hypothetical protein